MKTSVALKLIQNVEGIKLGELNLNPSIVERTLQNNKGVAGQLLELAIGLPLNSNLNDLEDGEIKTTILIHNKTRESLFVTQLNHVIDEMVNDVPWLETSTYKKLRQVLLVPCHKDSQNWRNWHFAKPILINEIEQPKFYEEFEADYGDIKNEVVKVIKTGGSLHTSNGRYKRMQIRTKDSKPYHPIWHSGKQISNKYFAIYLHSSFVRKLVNSSTPSGRPN